MFLGNDNACNKLVGEVLLSLLLGTIIIALVVWL